MEAAGFAGIDYFYYQVTDGVLQSNVVEVEVSVLAGLQTPPDPNSGPNPGPDAVPESDPDRDDESNDEPDDPELETTDSDNTEHSSTGDSGALSQIQLHGTPGGQFNGGKSTSVAAEANQGFYGGSSLQFGPLSGQPDALELMLRQELGQPIAWQDWDESGQLPDESTISVIVGSAASAAGFFSMGVGYAIMWALRGGAIMTALSSSLPSWRIIDPTTLLTAYQGANVSKSDQVEKLLRQ
jgi:hypothetical protein